MREYMPDICLSTYIDIIQKGQTNNSLKQTYFLGNTDFKLIFDFWWILKDYDFDQNHGSYFFKILYFQYFIFYFIYLISFIIS